ncbi:MAG: DsrE/DsrF/DrsH-like family protein [Burkholderiaceae bacterium]
MSEARRLVIVVWSCGPDRAGGAVLAAAPFVYALAARALDQEVEMHFTSSAVRWLVAGEAEAAYTDRARSKTVRDFIREAHAAGVKLYACAMARHEHARDETLIEEVEGVAGAATIVDAAAEADARVMIF